MKKVESLIEKMEKLNKIFTGIIMLDEIGNDKFQVSSLDSKHFGEIFSIDDARLNEFEIVLVDNITKLEMVKGD